MKCWKCKETLEDIPKKNISFRTICDHCSAWLHCCVNCLHYQPGLPNDCKIPGTEQIADRETCNFCDEFSLMEYSDSSPSISISDVSQKLFGEETNQPNKNFDDLFDD